MAMLPASSPVLAESKDDCRVYMFLNFDGRVFQGALEALVYFICCPVALSFQLHLNPGLETHTSAISFLELMALTQTHSLRCAVFNPDSLLFQMLHLASAAPSKAV